MSAPAFDLRDNQIWYADGDSGFYAVRLTNGAWPRACARRCSSTAKVPMRPGTTYP